MSDFEFNKPNYKPRVDYTETKLRVLLLDIQKRIDRNGKDFWIIKVQLDTTSEKSFLAFSGDWKLSLETLNFLRQPFNPEYYPLWANLTLRKSDKIEKVIKIEIED